MHQEYTITLQDQLNNLNCLRASIILGINLIEWGTLSFLRCLKPLLDNSPAEAASGQRDIRHTPLSDCLALLAATHGHQLLLLLMLLLGPAAAVGPRPPSSASCWEALGHLLLLLLALLSRRLQP
jgi:hypothetical protein